MASARREGRAWESDLAIHEIVDASKASWADLRHRILGFDDELLVVVMQDGARWLVYASSNLGAREHVFALGDDASIVYEAECIGRTDDELLDGRGLVFARWGDPF